VDNERRVKREMTAGEVPAVMHAVRLYAPGDPMRLIYEQVPTPRPSAGEALVRVHAAAITRGELEWADDRLPATPSYEFSGVVAAVGPDVDDVTVNQPVYALSGFDRDGAAAEYIVVPQKVLAPKPRTLGHTHSAAIPLAALSAWQGLFDHGDLKPGQRVLIHGPAGGVGNFAVQLARQIGAYVIGVASTANIDATHRLGADEVVDHTRQRFEEAVDAVDLVFDTVGGDRLERSLTTLRPGGTLVSVAEEPPVELAAQRKVAAVYFVVEPNRDQLTELARLADRGDLRPSIDEVFQLTDARSAFQRSLGNQRHGKIVLSIVDDDEPPQTLNADSDELRL
jgi:NADPH:quinone reductase-like Zn-dependent oxidoreductase